MKKVMILFAVTMLLASCSRIATADYEVLDYGQIVGVNEETGVFDIKSDNDSVIRSWTPDILYDELNDAAFQYVDKLEVGDKCFVYDNGDAPLLSKISVEDAKIINNSLCNWYWKELFEPMRFSVLIAMAIAVLAYWFLSPATETHISLGLFVILASTVIAAAMMAPGRKLEKVGYGQITAIEKKRVVLDGNAVVYAASLKDFATGEKFEAGDKVHLYRYGRHFSGERESVFLCSKELNEQALQRSPIYPEVVLKTIGVYWALLIAIDAFILPFWFKRKKKRKGMDLGSVAAQA